MKKIVLLLILGSSVFFANAQKVNGTVYSEHEAIDKTRNFWTTFVKGDKEAFLSNYADSVLHVINGVEYKKVRKDFGGYVDWWRGFENLKVEDDKPAFPDAFVYKNGDVWVQDWIKFSGIHKETGVNVVWKVHNLYRFDKNGKINFLEQHFDNSVFDEINNSTRTIENGTVYINHPYIVTVRKLINAFCKEDLATVKSFYAADARFSNIAKNGNDGVALETNMKQNKEIFENYDNITITQFGYPDCIYYAKNDLFTVYSWWNLSVTKKDGKKLSGIPFMLSHTFNKDGKIIDEFEYLDSRQLE
jgi:hypothetical protein